MKSGYIILRVTTAFRELGFELKGIFVMLYCIVWRTTNQRKKVEGLLSGFTYIPNEECPAMPGEKKNMETIVI